MIEITLAAEAWTDIDPGTEALLDKWLVGEGDTVRAGQPIANVVIIKSNQEVVAPVDGRIAKILVKSEETFARGKPIAMLEAAT
ncbi:MAG: lipoyl domain-containing protein [Burkholderiaceae bacterium]|nr:lipoyl domain-containing protein [Burkholderiaceae bacterium]